MASLVPPGRNWGPLGVSVMVTGMPCINEMQGILLEQVVVVRLRNEQADIRSETSTPFC